MFSIVTHTLCLHESNIGTPLTHHKTNKPRDSNSKLSCQPASTQRAPMKYSHNTHILLYRKELLLAVFFSCFRYIERICKKNHCECLYFVVLFDLWLMMISLVSFAYKLIHSSSRIKKWKKFTINQSIKFTTRITVIILPFVEWESGILHFSAICASSSVLSSPKFPFQQLVVFWRFQMICMFFSTLSVLSVFHACSTSVSVCAFSPNNNGCSQ